MARFNESLHRANTVSRSSYLTAVIDHVAICVKLPQFPDEVWFLEAAGSGVWFKNWTSAEEPGKSIKKHVGTFYNKVAVRKLKFEKT